MAFEWEFYLLSDDLGVLSVDCAMILAPRALECNANGSRQKMAETQFMC